MPTRDSPSLHRPVTRVLACLTEAPMREALRETLGRDLGFHVTHVADGRSVIERLRSGHFQVLIVTDELPDLDAWRLARMVHSGRFCEHAVRIVVLCRPEEVRLLGARGAEYRVRLQSSADLEHLPETLVECLAGDAKPQLLVIEDDPQCADLARAALDPLFEVQIAADGRTGLAHYRLQRYDLVLLDLALPDIPGEEVLGEIRSLDATQPIVIVTANGSLDAHAALVLQGACDFLVKPFDVGALREAARLALGERSFAAMRAEQSQAGTTLKDLFGRISVAEHMSSTGRNLAATRHLKSVLATYRPEPLSDADWEALMSEY